LENRVILTLEKGDTVEVVKYKYNKYFLVYTIKLKNGRDGYIIYEDGLFKKKN